MARKKTKSLFFKFENFLKKYQVSLSIILSTLLSVIAIIVSLNANTISRKEYEKNRVPVWAYKIINEENGSTRELQIVSLKPDIRLESFEAITPFNKTDKEIIISTKDILNLFDLENKILTYRNNLYITIINKDELIPETVKIDDTYPVILKIKYVLDNEIFYDYSLYKLNLRIFNNDFVKIISLSFIQKINEKDAQHIAAFLDYINKTECIEKGYFSGSDELFKSLENKDSTTAGFITWCNYYGQKSFRNIYILDSSNKNAIDQLEITIPLLLQDSLELRKAISNKDSIIKLPYCFKELRATSDRIDSFLKANPFCFKKDIECRRNTFWCSQTAFDEWEYLLTNEKIRIWKAYNPNPLTQ